jgi:hypothetical protein
MLYLWIILIPTRKDGLSQNCGEFLNRRDSRNAITGLRDLFSLPIVFCVVIIFSSMVIGYFHVIRIAFAKPEADTPLIIYRYGILNFVGHQPVFNSDSF